jgi:hypothetical protein
MKRLWYFMLYIWANRIFYLSRNLSIAPSGAIAKYGYIRTAWMWAGEELGHDENFDPTETL